MSRISLIVFSCLVLVGCNGGGGGGGGGGGSQPSKADLFNSNSAFQGFSPTTISAGQTLTIDCYVDNSGETDSGAFAIKFYASTDTTIAAAGDYYIGQATMNNVPGGGTNWWCRYEGAFPAGIPAGVYYVGWIIDANGDVPESNESNNVAHVGAYQLNVEGSGAGSLQFDAASYTAGEYDGSITVTVTRTGGSSGAIGVSYATSNGSATAGIDYTAASGTLSWADGDSDSKSFTVSITDDVATEGDEVFSVALSSPTGGASLGSPDAATVTILDDECPQPGSLQFSAATYSVNENGGSVTISVTRTGGNSGVVGVSYATSNGSATAGTDYTAKSGSLSWADGDIGSKSFTVSITNDSTYEGNETFTVALTIPTGGASLGSPSTSTVTIVEDDSQPTGSLQFAASSYSISENGGSVTISVTRTGGSSGPVGVSYATSNGSATAGADYTAKSGTLSWSNGDTGSKSFTVSITNDGTYEGNETFTVALSNPTGGASLGSPSTSTVTIVEDDPQPPGSLQFSASNYDVNENGGSVTVYVTRTGGSGGAVSVGYRTVNNTASAGSDYTAKSGTLSWSNGDGGTKSISISITNDSAYEGNEKFVVLLENATGGATLGTPNPATVTIINDDPQPDLAGSSWYSPSPSLVLVGQTFTMGLNVTCSNSSSGAHVTRFYFSTDSTITSGDYLIGTYSSSGIASGAYEHQSVTVSFPSSVPCGRFYIGCIIDAAGQVSESNESNNSSVCPVQVLVDDAHENDDSMAQADAKGTLPDSNTVYHAHHCDTSDYYKIVASWDFEITLDLTHSEGDLDMELLSSSGDVLETSTSSTNQEFISHRGSIIPTTYYIRVYRYNNATPSGQGYNIKWLD